MTEPQTLGSALARFSAMPVEGCDLPCCKPGSKGITFGERLARWRQRHGASPDEPLAEQLAPDGLPMCSACGGRRWLRRELSLGDPDFGKAVRCQECPAEARESQRAQLARNARLGEAQASKTFATFKRRAGTEAALDAARAWSAEPNGWLVIHGTPDPFGDNRLGQGKTHLACAVVNALIDRLVAASWWYTPDAVAAFQAAIATNNTAEVLDRFQRTPVLVLDDLGAARATEFAIQQFLEPLLNYRERNRLPTLVTCIGDPAAIRGFVSESIGRRFQDPSLCRVVAITADQYAMPAKASH